MKKIPGARLYLPEMWESIILCLEKNKRPEADICFSLGIVTTKSESTKCAGCEAGGFWSFGRKRSKEVV